jgi:hypothetical protein
LNCVPPAKKKGIRSGLPLLLRIMGLRVHFPSGSPRGRTQRKPQPRLFYPESNPAPYDDLLLGAACGPSCSPKDQQLYSFSFVFQPKTTRQQTNKQTWCRVRRGGRERERPIVVGDSGTGLPVRTLKHQPTNYHLKTNETTRPKEMFTTGEN